MLTGAAPLPVIYRRYDPAAMSARCSLSEVLPIRQMPTGSQGGVRRLPDVDASSTGIDLTTKGYQWRTKTAQWCYLY
jgi:hypothetical protein